MTDLEESAHVRGDACDNLSKCIIIGQACPSGFLLQAARLNTAHFKSESEEFPQQLVHCHE